VKPKPSVSFAPWQIPTSTILGHMTGRQLLRRPGYDVDIEKVLAACAAHDGAVEINANPWRLDLVALAQKALELGCFMSINPDAHSTREIDLTHWGVAMARKGSVPKSKVLNCLSLKRLEIYLQKRSQHHPTACSQRSATGSPRRTKVSVPCLVYKSNVSVGRHASGSPNTTMAESAN
jgi:DNA polymerase (family 10)